jgi:3-hydroxybutyryl-CoA dehydrogenase
MMMPHGKVPFVGEAGDRLTPWLRERLEQAGYAPREANPGLRRHDMPESPLPAAAGLDLRRVPRSDDSTAARALEAELPVGCPILVRCEAAPVDLTASHLARPARAIGFSLFGILSVDMVVELVPGTRATPEALRRATMFFESVGFRVHILPRGSWPIYPRVMAMIINEAAVAVGDGVAAPADIDQAMILGAGYPVGPLALADQIGLDEVLDVLEALQREYGDDRYRPALLLRRLVRAGYTGQAVGRGFHLYANADLGEGN